MEIAKITIIFAQFGVGLLVAAVWLLICKLIRGLRRRPALSYGIASILAWIGCLTFPKGPSLSGLMMGLVIAIILYRQQKRALKLQSMEVNTIISFEHQNYF